jgi:hypothetical protein
MPLAVDHVADVNGVELVRLSRLYEFPPFVKKANLEQTMRPRSLPANVYAYNRRGQPPQFPCDSAASTWLSALYFTEKEAEFHPKEAKRISGNISHYARYWHIKAAVDQMRARHEAYVKEATAGLPDAAYAWVYVDESGHKERRLRLANPMEVKSAADWLYQYHERIPFADANVIARKILDKSAEFGASVSGHQEFLEKKAGMGVCNPDRVVKEIWARSNMVKGGVARTEVIKLAQVVAGTPRKALQPAMLVKLATTLDMIDRANNLTHHYGKTLSRPEDVVFEATFTKSAAELHEHVATTSGKVYKKSTFEKLSLDDVRGLFGDDFADEVRAPLGGIDGEKMAEVVRTLPIPDALLFDKFAAEHRISPVLTKAASAKQGFTEKDFEVMASAYV